MTPPPKVPPQVPRPAPSRPALKNPEATSTRCFATTASYGARSRKPISLTRPWARRCAGGPRWPRAPWAGARGRSRSMRCLCFSTRRATASWTWSAARPRVVAQAVASFTNPMRAAAGGPGVGWGGVGGGERFQLRHFIGSGHFTVSTATLTGVTPLHFASEQGNLPVAEYLLDHGADVNGYDHVRHGRILRGHGETKDRRR